jgi:hypothetical protein
MKNKYEYLEYDYNTEATALEIQEMLNELFAREDEVIND